jgi:hypothetical protein
MKKLVMSAVIVLAASAIAVGVASGSGGGGYVYDSGFACGIFDGNGNIFVTNNSELWVYSNQQSAKIVLRCSGDGAPASSLTYYNYGNTGALCSTYMGSYLTTDWSDKVGRNGNSQLTCTYSFNGGDSASISSAGGRSGLG